MIDSVRQKQKSNRRARLDRGDRITIFGVDAGVRPFKRSKSGRLHHKRSQPGRTRWMRKAAVDAATKAAIETRCANEARIATLRAQGLPLPGQSPNRNPATVRKG